MTDNKIIYTVYYIIILSFVIMSLAARSEGKWRTHFKNFGIWVMIFMAALVAFSFKPEFVSVKERVLSVLVPGRSYARGEYIVVTKNADDHYYITIEVNDYPVRFLIDTGASEVTLTRHDAMQAGATLGSNYKVFSTANGRIRAFDAYAGFKLQSMSINNFRFYVSDADTNISLLGMSFLSLFDEVKFDNDRLYLKIGKA